MVYMPYSSYCNSQLNVVSVILTLNLSVNVSGMFLSPSCRIFGEFLCCLCPFGNQSIIPFTMTDVMKLLLVLTGIRSLLSSPAFTSSGSERDSAELCMGWPVKLT